MFLVWNGDFLAHYFTDNSEMRSELRTIQYENKGKVFTFFSDLGVFSKDKIDYGSRVLVETILNYPEEVSSILDVGCGYGFIGIVLGSLFHARVSMVDVNARAIHLTEKNIKENKVDGEVFISDGYDHVKEKYDMVVTNPPIRAGKSVVLKILRDASHFLNDKGKLWFVIRKDQGVKSIMKEIENHYHLEVMEKSKGFYVVLATLK